MKLDRKTKQLKKKMSIFIRMHSGMGKRLCCGYRRLDAHFTGKKVNGITVKNDLRCGRN